MMAEHPQMAQVSDIQARYSEMLMQKAHVIGVGVGLCKQNGEYTDEFCLVVLVDQKVPADQLAPQDLVPREIEGVRVDVQETGTFAAL